MKIGNYWRVYKENDKIKSSEFDEQLVMAGENTTEPSACLFEPSFYITTNTTLPTVVESTWLGLAIINGVTAPIIFVLNLIILVVILRDKELRDGSFNILLSALALTDLLEGLLVQPLFCRYLVCLLLRCSATCPLDVYIIPSLLCGFWTALTLAIVSVERYLAINHPQFYLEKVTPKKVVVITALTWFIGSFIFLASRLAIESVSLNSRKLPIALFGALLVGTIVFCNIKVQITAFRHRRTINEQSATLQQHNEEEQQGLTERQDYIIAFTMFMIVLSTVLFYLPFFVVSVIQFVRGIDFTHHSRYISNLIVLTFVHLQSLLNPVLVSLRLDYIRDAVKKSLSHPCEKQQTSSSAMANQEHFEEGSL